MLPPFLQHVIKGVLTSACTISYGVGPCISHLISYHAISFYSQVSESEVLCSLEGALKDRRSSVALKAYILVALLKLTLRFAASKE